MSEDYRVRINKSDTMPKLRTLKEKIKRDVVQPHKELNGTRHRFENEKGRVSYDRVIRRGLELLEKEVYGELIRLPEPNERGFYTLELDEGLYGLLEETAHMASDEPDFQAPEGHVDFSAIMRAALLRLQDDL